jgi:hypothetical protein
VPLHCLAKSRFQRIFRFFERRERERLEATLSPRIHRKADGRGTTTRNHLLILKERNFDEKIRRKTCHLVVSHTRSLSQPKKHIMIRKRRRHLVLEGTRKENPFSNSGRKREQTKLGPNQFRDRSRGGREETIPASRTVAERRWPARRRCRIGWYLF